MTPLIVALSALFVVWLASHVVEALRPAPAAPNVLPWDPDVMPAYVMVQGARLRYVKTGVGPALVLLHTLRTQLDLFYKVIPDLARDHTVYALDLPGHGYSDIPEGPYDADFFVRHVAGFLEALDLTAVSLAGVSIGANIALIIAARRNPRVAGVISINLYDYDRGKGMARASLPSRIVMRAAGIPIVGETIMRLRSYPIIRSVLLGGVSDPRSVTPALMRELYEVGNRRGHYRAFVSLLRHASSWDRARAEYRNVTIPALLIWGADDWARPEERRYDESLVPGLRSVTIAGGGHFLPLDRPAEVMRHIRYGAAIHDSLGTVTDDGWSTA